MRQRNGTNKTLFIFLAVEKHNSFKLQNCVSVSHRLYTVRAELQQRKLNQAITNGGLQIIRALSTLPCGLNLFKKSEALKTTYTAFALPHRARSLDHKYSRDSAERGNEVIELFKAHLEASKSESKIN
ncbi:MAG: hypothetical protein ACJAZP_003628 [Psychromonas sp.]|jgi:hypothetical protein|uniref:hypothetical protein n=1 Tax=Psychromonas sp. TaxID=1884585 RepID=UPI0039E32C1F